MKKTVIPDHIVGWFEKLKANIEHFRELRHNMSVDGKILYIRQQYALLEIIISVLDDEMYFVGVRHDNINKEDQEHKQE